MQQFYKIDKDTGLFIEPVLFDDGIIPVDEDIVLVNIPEGFHLPKWDKVNEVWIEGKVIAIDDVKQAKIANVKVEAAEKINVIAPIWKQVNILREVGVTDPKFAEIDAIRTRSNELESQVNAALTVEEIELVVW